MTDPSSPDSILHDGWLAPALAWQKALLDTFALVQRSQSESYAVIQQAIAEFNQDLLDRWMCRFGGGVPLDG